MPAKKSVVEPKATSERITLKGEKRARVVYVGPKGGKYVKKDGKYMALKSLPKSGKKSKQTGGTGFIEDEIQIQYYTYQDNFIDRDEFTGIQSTVPVNVSVYPIPETNFWIQHTECTKDALQQFPDSCPYATSTRVITDTQNQFQRLEQKTITMERDILISIIDKALGSLESIPTFLHNLDHHNKISQLNKWKNDILVEKIRVRSARRTICDAAVAAISNPQNNLCIERLKKEFKGLQS